jgi:stearoyl-CoA desaturase (delta-9 desaturase)
VTSNHEVLVAPVAAIPGIVTLDDRQHRGQKIAVLVITLIPFLGLVAAVATLWGRGLSVVDASIMFVFYMVSGLGVTVGFHRSFTHLSFKPTPPTKAALAVCGSLAMQGSVISWVAAHRRHHAFSDQVGDPHSPHLDEAEGFVGIVKGLWHAHVGWLFDRHLTDQKRWAPDLLKDPVMTKIDRLFPLISVFTFVLPALAGLAITRTWQGGLTAFLWGALARIFLLHHVTWSINSICHYFGKRPFETTDHSTNNWPLALISFGESWHNNHHAFPSSAIHGLKRGQVDMTAGVIRVLEKLRLAADVKTVSVKQLKAKAVDGMARVRPSVLSHPTD